MAHDRDVGDGPGGLAAFPGCDARFHQRPCLGLGEHGGCPDQRAGHRAGVHQGHEVDSTRAWRRRGAPSQGPTAVEHVSLPWGRASSDSHGCQDDYPHAPLPCDNHLKVTVVHGGEKPDKAFPRGESAAGARPPTGTAPDGAVGRRGSPAGCRPIGPPRVPRRGRAEERNSRGCSSLSR